MKYETNKPNRMRRHYRARQPKNIVMMIEEELILTQCLDCGLFQKNIYTIICKSAKGSCLSEHRR